MARVLLNKRPQTFHDLSHGLNKFWLVRVALVDVVDKLVGGGVRHGFKNCFGAKMMILNQICADQVISNQLLGSQSP